MVRHKLMAVHYDDDFAQDVREAVRKMGFAFSSDMSPGHKKSLTRRALEQHASNPYLNKTTTAALSEAGSHKLKVRPTSRHQSFSREPTHKRVPTQIVFTLFQPDTPLADRVMSLDEHFLHQLEDQRPRLKLLLQAKDPKKSKEVSRKAFLESI